MTQVVFLKRIDLPTNKQIQEIIQKLGYDFKILSELELQIDEDGLECSINGHETYFESNIDSATNAVNELEADWIKPDLTNQDTAISFFWGADFAAGACIGLISVALIEHCGALVYYMDDEMKYSKEALLMETPIYLTELAKEANTTTSMREQPLMNIETKEQASQISFWAKLKDLFK